MRLNETEFERRSEEFFAASYLTSIGVIQNVALGLLGLKVFGKDFSALLLLQGTGSFLVILLVVIEYSWWLLLVRGTPNFEDVVLPYLLGLFELGAISYVDDIGNMWFILMAILGVAGIAARMNARRHCTKEMFIECQWLWPETLTTLDIGTEVICAVTLGMIFMSVIQNLIAEWVKIIYFFLFYSFIIGMVAVSAVFISKTRKEFEQKHEPKPKEES
jgi:hypothetical protein